MIDIENKVFTTVYNAVIAEYPSADIKGEYVDIPSAFPHISVVEVGNTTLEKTQDNTLTEHNATILYEVNVYSNAESGKKAQAKKIANVVDLAMQNMKFTRTSFMSVPNTDRTIYRINLRYRAIVGEGVTTTEDGVTTTIYQMYRK